MERYRGWMLFGLGLFLALAAGGLTFFVLQQQRTAAEEESRKMALAAVQVPTVQLPVAARALEPGLVLSDADFVIKNFPADLVPTTAVTQSISLERQILTEPVGAGETFRSDKFLGNTGATMSQQIEPGKVLVAFPIIDLLSQSNLVKDGDRVDLMLTIAPEKAEGEQTETKTTAITLQNIQVFKVLRATTDEEKEDAGGATAFLCSMTPQDSLLLKFIKDSGGTIDFALRSSLDQDEHTATPIDMQEINQRYLAR